MPSDTHIEQNSPLVSIIMPVYNSARYLDTAIRSILAQTYANLELLAIDDGSTDSSLTILRNYAHHDKRVRVLTQANQGPYVARNLGLRVAAGEWITFFDADDWLHPERVETALRTGTDQELDVVICNAFTFRNDVPPVELRKPILNYQDRNIFTGDEWIIESVKNGKWSHYLWTQLISSDFIKKKNLAFRIASAHMDILWTMDMALNTPSIAIIPECLCGYRSNPESIVRSNSDAAATRRARSYLVVIKNISEIAASLRSTYPALSRALYKQANIEGGHFMGLMRKKIRNKTTLTQLSKEFLLQRLHVSMLRGASAPNEYWRAVRCTLIAFRHLSLTRPNISE